MKARSFPVTRPYNPEDNTRFKILQIFFLFSAWSFKVVHSTIYHVKDVRTEI
jgi:hypothetical protein